MIRCTHRTIDRFDTPRPAIFLDRDGTLTEYRGFITEPSQIQLVESASEVIRSLRAASFAIVLITNQSAIGRGLINDDQLHDIHTELVDQLRCGNAALDAIYFCPEAPLGLDETIVETPDRKPGHGMLLMAARDLNLDLFVASWYWTAFPLPSQGGLEDVVDHAAVELDQCRCCLCSAEVCQSVRSGSGQNREAVYRDARMVKEQLEAGQAREQQLREENQRLREENGSLQQTAAYNPFTDPAKVDQYAAMAQAEGVSLPVAQRLFG